MIELLRIVIWPVCVIACVVFVVLYFRRQVAALLDRTISVGKHGLRTSEPRGQARMQPDSSLGIERDGVPSLTRRLRFFVTTPLSGIGTQDEYDAFMAQMRPIVGRIRSIKNVDSVYYFNELIPTIDYVLKDKWSVPDYLNELDQADYVIIIVNTSTVSAVYFEAGYALGREIKAIYFVGPQGKIPLLMKQSPFTYPKLVRHQTFNPLEEIPELLRQIMPVLQDEEANKRLHLVGDARPVTGR